MLVVTGCNAAEVLLAVGRVLDPSAVLVAAFVILDRALALTTTGDRRDRVLLE